MCGKVPLIPALAAGSSSATIAQGTGSAAPRPPERRVDESETSGRAIHPAGESHAPRAPWNRNAWRRNRGRLEPSLGGVPTQMDGGEEAGGPARDGFSPGQAGSVNQQCT